MHGSREGNAKHAKRCSEEGGGTAEAGCGLSRAVFGNACVALRKCKAREGDARKREVVLLKLPVAKAEHRYKMHLSR